MSRFIRTFLLTMILLAILAAPVMAQSQPEFRLNANRNFGYGAGSNVRGDFTLRIYGASENIRAVTYLMDGNPIATVESAPFEFRFNTGQYPSGQHELVASVETVDGRTVLTPPLNLNFLSAEQEAESMQRILIPVLAAVLGLTVIGVTVQGLAARGDSNRMAPGAPRHYGVKGGTICPRCNRPYAIHFFSMNLVVGVLDRCPFCGKWAVVRRYDPSVLAAAEQAERDALAAAESAPIGNGSAESEEDRLRKLLDESKYVDHN